jgi:hypothetical protein
VDVFWLRPAGGIVFELWLLNIILILREEVVKKIYRDLQFSLLLYNAYACFKIISLHFNLIIEVKINGRKNISLFSSPFTFTALRGSFQTRVILDSRRAIKYERNSARTHRNRA